MPTGIDPGGVHILQWHTPLPYPAHFSTGMRPRPCGRDAIERGWMTFDDATLENNGRARIHRLRANCRKQVEIETSPWVTLAAVPGSNPPPCRAGGMTS